MADDKPTVFYDGSCPLCIREIGYYRKQTGAEHMDWVDVSACPAGAEVAPGLSRTDAMAQLHMRTADGRLIRGAGAFALLWSRLPKFEWFGHLAGQPIVRRALDMIYVWVLLPLRPFVQWVVRAAGAR
jgi:predicted DCC family thiol-disulfide oxidoreductase YuxK